MTEFSFPSLKSLSLSQDMCLTLVIRQLLTFCNSLPSKREFAFFVLFLNPTEKLQDLRGAFYMQRPLSAGEHQAGKILRQSSGVHEYKENLQIQQKGMQEGAQRQPGTEMQLAEKRELEQNFESQLNAMQQREENLQRELNETKQREKDFESQLSDMQEREENLQRELNETKQREQDFESQLSEMQEREENLQTQLYETQQREQDYESQLSEMQEREEETRAQLNKMQQRKRNSRRQLRELQQREVELQRQINQMQQREQMLLAEKQELEQNFESHLSEMQEREENLQSELNETQQREQEFESRLSEMQEREENLQSELNETQQREQDFESRLSEMQEWEENLQSELYETRQREQDYESRLSDMQEREENLHGRLNELHGENSELQLRLRCDWVISRDEIEMTDNLLGRGAWASVYEGVYCGCPVAVKQIHDLLLSDYNIRLFEREMSIASKCRHPHLLQFVGATNDQESPLFVTELMMTSLRDLLQERQLLVQEIYVLCLDIARALNYLHQKKPVPIIHRDVSSANVLLWRQGDQWRGKVSDYGTANFMQQTMTVGPGAMIYSAPESSTPNQTVKVVLFFSN